MGTKGGGARGTPSKYRSGIPGYPLPPSQQMMRAARKKFKVIWQDTVFIICKGPPNPPQNMGGGGRGPPPTFSATATFPSSSLACPCPRPNQILYPSPERQGLEKLYRQRAIKTAATDPCKWKISISTAANDVCKQVNRTKKNKTRAHNTFPITDGKPMVNDHGGLDL